MQSRGSVRAARGWRPARVGIEPDSTPHRPPRQSDLAVLQRCAQGFQCAEPNLGALVEEQPRGGPTDRPRPGQPEPPPTNAATLEVMRGDKRRPGDQRGPPGSSPAPVDGRHLERLGRRRVRQQTGKSLCQHRLTHAGWPGQHQVVGTGRGDLDGESGLGLAHHVGEIGDCAGRRRRRRDAAVNPVPRSSQFCRSRRSARRAPLCRHQNSLRRGFAASTTTVGQPLRWAASTAGSTRVPAGCGRRCQLTEQHRLLEPVPGFAAGGRQHRTGQTMSYNSPSWAAWPATTPTSAATSAICFRSW